MRGPYRGWRNFEFRLRRHRSAPGSSGVADSCLHPYPSIQAMPWSQRTLRHRRLGDARNRLQGSSCGCVAFQYRITPPRSSPTSCAATHCEFARCLSFNFPSCTPISTATNLRRMRDAMHGCYVDSAGLRLVVCDKSAAESRRGRHRCLVAHHASKNQRTLMGKHAAPPASIAGASSSHHLTRRHRHRSPAQPAARSCLYYGRRDS